MSVRPLSLALAAAVTACANAGESIETPAPSAASAPPLPSPPPVVAAAPAGLPHVRVDGQAFPDKVIALTWDDGPDVSTLELAAYLKNHRISATFFVVRSWVDGLSDDPGDGKGVFESGYEFLPILGDLVELGHRVGNHTLHHVGLREAAGAATVDRELRENQQSLDPFLTNELRLFRAPGGGWGSFAAGIVDGDPYLQRMVGPIAWDVDRKDWDESLHCRGPRGAFECERHGPGGALRMKPAVVAARYVASIESAGHGIVLLHDRVGHVGSTYGLDVAQAMIPQLEARGFVFAAPVLRFSPLVVRHREADLSDARRWDPASLRLGDVNGDGREDLCGRDALGVRCAISVQSTSGGDSMPRTVFRRSDTGTATATVPAGEIRLADVSGDGQDDVCVAAPTGIACATSNVAGELGAFRTWSRDDHAAAFRFADVDGDGKADACSRTAAGIACAHNAGKRFEAARTWLADMSDARGWGAARFASTVQLADVDGDGRADVCGRGPNGVACALSSGKGFGKVEKWAVGADFAEGELHFGDLNGDRRADVCGHTREGIACALSTARGFTKATLWHAGDVTEAQLGDVNGDGRADLCGRAPEGLACALAP
ncbi:MAG: Rhs family protein [Labilithrix sp.]|nr:Rhs family protein [Labilithrix sp.]